jgi:hypothetical protein
VDIVRVKGKFKLANSKTYTECDLRCRMSVLMSDTKYDFLIDIHNRGASRTTLYDKMLVDFVETLQGGRDPVPHMLEWSIIGYMPSIN